MGLKIIGAGLGRTGTESLKKALEYLGYTKCYHMFELMKDGNMLDQWQRLRNGNLPTTIYYLKNISHQLIFHLLFTTESL